MTNQPAAEDLALTQRQLLGSWRSGQVVQTRTRLHQLVESSEVGQMASATSKLRPYGAETRLSRISPPRDSSS